MVAAVFLLDTATVCASGRQGSHRSETRSNQTLAAFYQCHGRPKAVARVLELFRHNYPSSHIQMINDGGDPVLHDIASIAGAEYTYFAKSSSLEGTVAFGTIDQCSTWVQRLTSVVDVADWTIILEDDVHVLQKVPLESLQFDINGDNPDSRLPDLVIKSIEIYRHGPLVDAHYGCPGGCILRNSFLRHVVTQADWMDNVRLICGAILNDSKNDRRLIYTDQLITGLLRMYGATLGNYRGFLEKWRPEYHRRWQARDIIVLHQEKSLYT